MLCGTHRVSTVILSMSMNCAQQSKKSSKWQGHGLQNESVSLCMFFAILLISLHSIRFYQPENLAASTSALLGPLHRWLESLRPRIRQSTPCNRMRHSNAQYALKKVQNPELGPNRNSQDIQTETASLTSSFGKDLSEATSKILQNYINSGSLTRAPAFARMAMAARLSWYNNIGVWEWFFRLVSQCLSWFQCHVGHYSRYKVQLALCYNQLLSRRCWDCVPVCVFQVCVCVCGESTNH